MLVGDGAPEKAGVAHEVQLDAVHGVARHELADDVKLMCAYLGVAEVQRDLPVPTRIDGRADAELLTGPVEVAGPRVLRVLEAVHVEHAPREEEGDSPLPAPLAGKADEVVAGEQ